MVVSRSIYWDKPVKRGEIITFENKKYKVLSDNDSFYKGAFCQGYYIRISEVK